MLYFTYFADKQSIKTLIQIISIITFVTKELHFLCVKT